MAQQRLWCDTFLYSMSTPLYSTASVYRPLYPLEYVEGLTHQPHVETPPRAPPKTRRNLPPCLSYMLNAQKIPPAPARVPNC